MSQASDCQAQCIAQLAQRRTAHIPQFGTLERAPNPFIWVQLGRIARQAFQMYPFCGLLSQERFDRLAVVDRCIIPEKEQLARQMPQQMLEQPYHRRSFVSMILHLDQQPSRWWYRTDDRQMIVAEWYAQNRSFPTRCVRPNNCRQQIEISFIDPEKRAFFGYGAWPRG